MPKLPRVRPPSGRGRRGGSPRTIGPTRPPKSAEAHTGAIDSASRSTTDPSASSTSSATSDASSIGTSTAVGTGEGFSGAGAGDFAGVEAFSFSGDIAPGLENVHPQLAQRISALSAATGGAVGVNEGFRTRDVQQQRWNDYINGDGNLAAQPGTSNHEFGLAVDVTGYDQISPELLDRFGLAQTVPGEPWHLELDPSTRMQSVDDDWMASMGMEFDLGGQQNPEEVLANRLNAITSMLGMDLTANPYTAGDTSMTPGDLDPTYNMVENAGYQGMDPTMYPGAARDSVQGQGDLERFMGSLRQMESSGDYGAVGPSTRYGRATGAYQFLDSTWRSRPGTQGYARAADAPPQVQDQVAREYMQELYSKYGDWQLVAVAWHGGEGAANQAMSNGYITGGDVNMSTRNYANTIVSRM